MNATPNFIRYSEPTVRNNAALAYSQCMPESDHGSQPQPQYGPYYNEYNPMPQQPMAVQAPVAKSSSAGKGLLLVAGLAVVGAAAFGGVMLLNSSGSPTTHAAATAATHPAGSTVVNLPSALDIPALAPAQNAPAPVIVNNSGSVGVSGPVFVPRSVAAPKAVAAPAQKLAPALASAPAAPALAPAAAASGPGVAIKAPGVEVGVPSDGGASVKTPGVEVGVPGAKGGDVVVAVPDGQNPAQTKTGETEKGGTTPAQGAVDAAAGVAGK